MIDWATVKGALGAWFAGNTEIPVVWTDAPAPDPALAPPVGELSILGVESVGLDEVRPGPAPETVLVVGNRVATLRCSVRGLEKGALFKLEMARESLERPTVREGLRASGLALYGRPSTSIDQDNDRASMDLRLGLTSVRTDHTGQIDDVDFEGSF